MSKLSIQGWDDRFALIEALKPSDEQICSTFGVTNDELATAKTLRDRGMFNASKSSIDVNRYTGLFTGETARKSSYATTHVRTSMTSTKFGSDDKPESATRKSAVSRTPQKRGRKGNKIENALMAVSANPVPVDDFIKTHGVSLAVLRQAKRFATKINNFTGAIKVKQDKESKRLVIWRQDQE